MQAHLIEQLLPSTQKSSPPLQSPPPELLPPKALPPGALSCGRNGQQWTSASGRMDDDNNDEVLKLNFVGFLQQFCSDSRPLEAGVFSLMRTLES
jgi:hypothetical protein